MAKRRCFSIDVIESTAYRKLSKDAKILYFALIAHSDDEGVVINPSIPLCLMNIEENILAELTESSFLIRVDDIYVIRHWYRHNKIQPTRINKSLYQAQLLKLTVNDLKEYEYL